MSDQLDLNQLPKTTQELISERDQLRAEVNRLRAEVAELKQALEAARQELRDKAAITAERDLYYQELGRMWEEKLADTDRNGVDLAEVIAEIENDRGGLEQHE